ncbi:Transcription factor RFX4 [Liparis tanakae]|uniref:Transcription factor RFX4 n=1 Tax=Liparis tanakae TaxID=230148 RepID=A0A4Z2FGM2_9TELE|nr:Transcription factor RFX4 [Liparis tanakae]
MHCGLLEEPDMDSTESWIERCLNESESKRYSSHTSLGNMSNDEHEEKENNRASKPHSTPATLEWLEENYEIAEGVCIPRSALYMHYLDFSEKHDTQPVNAASFGKIIRQQFPALTTRRLGTRGQSKYHYYGIAVKETSQYYDVMYSKKGAAWVNETGKKEVTKQTVAYSPRSKLGTLLPEFPNVKDLNLPASLPEDRVQSFLLHFWQGMPPHMLPVLGSSTVVNIVGVCDSILYKAISGVLMPTVLQALPDSLTQVIRKFAKQLDEWLKIALHDLPENLRNIKFELSRRFSQILKRQTSLNHLCQASRTVINSADITFQMLEDWRNVDLNSITKQTLYTMEDSQEEHRQLIIHLYQEFDRLLEEQSPIEAYIEWLDLMVDRCVVKVAGKRPGCLKKVAQQFLLMWSCFGTRVIRDMTLHSAPSFGERLMLCPSSLNATERRKYTSAMIHEHKEKLYIVVYCVLHIEGSTQTFKISQMPLQW